MYIAGCYAVEIALAEDIGIDVGAIVGGRLVKRIALIELRSQLWIERHLCVAFVEGVAKSQKSPFGQQVDEDSLRVVPCAHVAKPVETDVITHFEGERVEWRAGGEVDPDVGTGDEVVGNGIEVARIAGTGQVVHDQMASGKEVGQGLPPAVEYGHESLANLFGLYLSPIDVKFGESLVMYILEQGSCQIGTVVGE